MSVLLPEPEGPQTTITSPFSTRVVQFVSTWKFAYHLLTFLNSIIGMALPSLSDDGDALLQVLDPVRQRKRNDEVNHGHEQVHLDQSPVTLRNLGRGTEEVGDREHVNQGGVLEQDDGLG